MYIIYGPHGNQNAKFWDNPVFVCYGDYYI